MKKEILNASFPSEKFVFGVLLNANDMFSTSEILDSDCAILFYTKDLHFCHRGLISSIIRLLRVEIYLID